MDAQDIQKRKPESINVRDYGAKGDGTADETAAIQSAIDAMIANGLSSIEFPPGDYLTFATLTVKEHA